MDWVIKGLIGTMPLPLRILELEPPMVAVSVRGPSWVGLESTGGLRLLVFWLTGLRRGCGDGDRLPGVGLRIQFLEGPVGGGTDEDLCRWFGFWSAWFDHRVTPIAATHPTTLSPTTISKTQTGWHWTRRTWYRSILLMKVTVAITVLTLPTFS